ncbi:GNAT family N-acetyltransferase [Anaerocolumna sp. AGMB13025]|uniref:GNAT family N-acetyltransferase n=1 Tax=Anaerocolumna sp. AGMB13025 TaxID=3039116 RepID=UPI00241D78BC|nr:GNAT family N-acetyltransferase [Anaerocolumna sp. AGMB13025]WFR54714.1 GNAT family N-acetyltransferase [Anaerocolumna sp. AGMB13025]
MDIKFRKFSEFHRGMIYDLLKDGYSFESRYERDWAVKWKEADDFFYDNLQIADECGFVTAFKDTPIGFICWDPRNLPEYIELGHNCIATKYKGNQYGKMQLLEAVKRMSNKKAKKLLVTTDELLVPAQKNYESVGFTFVQKRNNEWNQEYAGKLLDYEMKL